MGKPPANHRANDDGDKREVDGRKGDGSNYNKRDHTHWAGDAGARSAGQDQQRNGKANR